jgi:hypothetical protein
MEMHLKFMLLPASGRIRRADRERGLGLPVFVRRRKWRKTAACDAIAAGPGQNHQYCQGVGRPKERTAQDQNVNKCKQTSSFVNHAAVGHLPIFLSTNSLNYRHGLQFS